MEVVVALAAFGIAALAIAGLLFLAPAHLSAKIDTFKGVAGLYVKVLGIPIPGLSGDWAEHKTKSPLAKLIAGLRDVPRVTSALMVVPQLIPVMTKFVRSVRELNSQMSPIELSINVVAPVATAAIQMIEHALPKGAFGVVITHRQTPGADIRASIDVRGSVVQVCAPFLSFRSSAPVQEILRRLER